MVQLRKSGITWKNTRTQQTMVQSLTKHASDQSATNAGAVAVGVDMFGSEANHDARVPGENKNPNVWSKQNEVTKKGVGVNGLGPSQKAGELEATGMSTSDTKLAGDEKADAMEPKGVVIPTVPLNPINFSLLAVYTDGCCGIGHRLSRILPTLVWANRQGRKTHVVWDDIPWGKIFNDTDYVVRGHHDAGYSKAKNHKLLVTNSVPEHWEGEKKQYKPTGTVLDANRVPGPQYFDDDTITSMLVSLRDSLSPLVRSYLNSVRAQLNEARDSNGHVTMCTHVRQGNNEVGDWQDKTWRHIDLKTVLHSTHSVMKKFVLSSNATMASIYVASDNPEVSLWFGSHISKHWNLIQPKKVMPKPKHGVWFGQHGSKTSHVLNKTMKNEAMAEAAAEMFILGECDALIIPNYSSFSFPSIALTKARHKPVFLRSSTSLDFYEMSSFESFKYNYKQSIRYKVDARIGRRRYHRRLMFEENTGFVLCDEEL